MSSAARLAELLGIRRVPGDEHMQLPFTGRVQNHMGSMHASAQFALAEISSGDYLRRRFPMLQDRVVALVRRAEIKYSKQVSVALLAYPSVAPADEGKFLRQLDSAGRGLLTVDVRLKTAAGELATHALYHWFIKKI